MENLSYLSCLIRPVRRKPNTQVLLGLSRGLAPTDSRPCAAVTLPDACAVVTLPADAKTTAPARAATSEMRFMRIPSIRIELKQAGLWRLRPPSASRFALTNPAPRVERERSEWDRDLRCQLGRL